MKTCPKNLKYLIILWITFALLAGCQPKESVPPVDSATKPPAVSTKTPSPIAPTAVIPTATIAPSATQQLELINANLLLDPALTQDADSLKISQYLYEGLVRLDASGNPTAGLAEAWVVSDDQLDYIFTIRSGMTFSDGSPITPDVVAANFNRWFDPQNPLHGTGDYAAWQSTFLGFLGEKDADNRAKSPVDGIQKVDQYTVLVHLNRPVPELLTNMANPAFAILNPAVLSGGTYGGRESTILSSGPYLVKSWTDDGLQLSANPNYWGEAAPKDLKFGWRK
jgi:peptide/nickel transport system substrate-binding protein